MVPLTESARLVTCEDLLVDRHYRGAIVMVGARTFALAEEAIRVVERVQRGELRVARAAELAALGATLEELLAMGVLRAVPRDGSENER